MKKSLVLFLLLSMFAILIIFNPFVFTGASRGLNLWLYVVTPTLLPFLILTEILKSINGIEFISKYPAKFLSPIYKISGESSYAIIAGLLCGYPMGAKCVEDLHLSGKISTNEACYLMTFVNNPSPAFIVSYIFCKNLHNTVSILPYVIIFYICTLFTGLLLRFFYKFTPETNSTNKNITLNNRNFLDDSIMNSFQILIRIGGYIIIFSIATEVITSTFNLPLILTSAITCILEITNGINLLSITNINPQLSAFFMCLAASLGGLCTLMQIISMCHIPIKHFLFGKILWLSLFAILSSGIVLLTP